MVNEAVKALEIIEKVWTNDLSGNNEKKLLEDGRKS